MSQIHPEFEFELCGKSNKPEIFIQIIIIAPI